MQLCVGILLENFLIVPSCSWKYLIVFIFATFYLLMMLNKFMVKQTASNKQNVSIVSRFKKKTNLDNNKYMKESLFYVDSKCIKFINFEISHKNLQAWNNVYY